MRKKERSMKGLIRRIKRHRYYHIMASCILGFVSIPFFIRAYIELQQMEIEMSKVGFNFIIIMICYLCGGYHIIKECSCDSKKEKACQI